MSERGKNMITQESLFTAFKLAIDEEQKAYDLYMSLAEHCPESDLKELFKRFANDELGHKQTLMERYKKLNKG